MRTAILSLLLVFALSVKAQVAIDTALDFTVKDVHGGQHHLYNYLDAGNYVIIDFFTTNCGPCQTYASEVSASYEYFGCNGSNVVYMGINWGSDNTGVMLFDSLWGAHYPAVSGLQGGGNNVVESYQVQSYPTVILIAPDRSILNNHIWPPLRDTINANVLEAGGFPQACTVSTNHPDESPAPEIRAFQSSNEELLLMISGHDRSGLLQLYAADGRLTHEFRTAVATTVYPVAQLKPGMYIAILTESGRSRVSYKFLVR